MRLGVADAIEGVYRLSNEKWVDCKKHLQMARRRGSKPLGWLILLSTFVLAFGQTTSPDDIFFIKSFNDVNAILGFPGTLTCDADVIVNGAQVTYTIRKDSDHDYLNRELTRSRVTMDANNDRVQIRFAYLLEADAGGYTCIADLHTSSDPTGTFPERTAHANINVDSTTLRFLNELVQRYNATPGQDFVLNACATNFGNADIGNGRDVSVTWMKDGELLNLANRPDYSFNNATDELTIINYDAFEHNGTYSCVVNYDDSMPAGKRRKRAVVRDSRSTVVTIDGAPKLLSRPGFVYFRNVTVDGTSEHLVNCSMFLRYKVTEPVTTYTWYFPSTTSNALTRVANRNRPYVNDNDRLVLTWAHPQHSGQYRCYASNPFGVNATYFNITIVYPTPVIWVQFWMIIIYVVVFLSIVILLLALCIRFCCLGFCYVKQKKVVVDSTFYTTSKLEEMPEKIPLQDKTEFQEVEVDMQLAGVVHDSEDEDFELPPEVDVRKKKSKLTEYQEVVMDLPWDDEAEATKFHRLDLVEGTDDSRELVRVVKSQRRARREERREAEVEVHPRAQPRRRPAQEPPKPVSGPEVLPETPESQRKVPLDLVVVDDDTPYDTGPSLEVQRQQELLMQQKMQQQLQQQQVVTKKVVTKTVVTEEVVDDDALSEALSHESQVYEATFGMSDLESEEPPESEPEVDVNARKKLVKR